jgi:Flp pilus assembly protein TadD
MPGAFALRAFLFTLFENVLTVWYPLLLHLGPALSILFVSLALLAHAHPCMSCHPNEVQGYERSPMANSLKPVNPQPEGAFRHAPSGTSFTIHDKGSEVWQSFQNGNETGTLPVAYEVGSGSHALGFLAQIGDHLFQSPLSYYTSRQAWDVAPGYEQSLAPDFSRPVTLACLSCHSDKPRPIPDSLNSYLSPSFAQTGIECDRCHGSAEAHLKRPVPGSIINPAHLPEAARDSVCEQCHLAGEIRIPNPGKTVADFQPGQVLEDSYTVYVARHEGEKTIKVISQSEQLRLSVCARNSRGKLWCGTCHDPHQVPARPAEYFRERCLACHAGNLSPAHAAPGQNCVGCHVPRRPAKDGGHTAFTDHRISRHPEVEPQLAASADELPAWREPALTLRDRNLGLALVTSGMENHRPNQVIRGYRMLNRLEQNFLGDAAVQTSLGTILLTAKQPAEAQVRFERALKLRPNYAPYEVNLGACWLERGEVDQAIHHLERAVELDPLLEQAVQMLGEAYRRQGQQAKADLLLSRYRGAMGIAGSR